jgi:hypothetical protein
LVGPTVSAATTGLAQYLGKSDLRHRYASRHSNKLYCVGALMEMNMLAMTTGAKRQVSEIDKAA